ncbi:MAG: hypothetical protein ACTSWR_06060 [Candidatus Helarchaeota archaeon]
MVDQSYSVMKQRQFFSLAKAFEEHHLDKIIKSVEEYNSRYGENVLSLKFDRADENFLSEDLQAYIGPDEYVGILWQIVIINNRNECSIDILAPSAEDSKIKIFFNSNIHRGYPILGSDKVSLKNFTKEYVSKIINYMSNGYKRSLAPSLKILRNRGDIKKETKYLTIFGIIISIFLLIELSSFTISFVIFVLILIFLLFIYPKLDIKK